MANDKFKIKKKLRLPKLPSIKFNLSKKIIAKRARKIEGATIRHTHRFIIKRLGSVREVQRHVIVWVMMIGALIAATGLQLMWYQQNYKVSTPNLDSVYAEAVLGPIDTLNPIFASSSAEQSAGYLMFSRIAQYDIKGKLNFDLATKISINDSKTVYTVTIRPDARWHDGTKLTAEDIVFTVDLLKNPNVRSTITGWRDVSAKKIDDLTVEFTLKSIYAAFEHALNFPILPKHILGSVSPSSIRENNFSKSPIGSGPFKLSFVQDVDLNSGRKVINMVRNNDYYRGRAKLERFQLHVYGATDDIINALGSSEVNAAADLLPADIQRIDTKKYDVTYTPIYSGTYVLLNTKSSILSDVSVRRALQVGTDTKATRDKISKKLPALDLPFIGGQITGEQLSVPNYNVAQASKILDDTGWVKNAEGIRVKGGNELKLTVAAIKNSEFESVLETLVGQWRDIGVAVDTKIIDFSDVSQNAIQTILQPRNFDALVYQLNIGADPDVYAYWHSSQASSQGFNFSNYSHIISDEALLSARIRLEPELRNAKYITFAKQWISDVPAIGLYQSTMQYVKSSTTRSYDESNVLISLADRYADVLYWAVGEHKVYKTP